MAPSRRVFSSGGYIPPRELRRKDQCDTFTALESVFFTKNAVEDFVAAFQIEFKRGPTLTHVLNTRLSTKEILTQCLRELVWEHAVREVCHHGDSTRYEANIIY